MTDISSNLIWSSDFQGKILLSLKSPDLSNIKCLPTGKDGRSFLKVSPAPGQCLGALGWCTHTSRSCGSLTFLWSEQGIGPMMGFPLFPRCRVKVFTSRCSSVYRKSRWRSSKIHGLGWMILDTFGMGAFHGLFVELPGWMIADTKDLPISRGWVAPSASAKTSQTANFPMDSSLRCGEDRTWNDLKVE